MVVEELTRIGQVSDEVAELAERIKASVVIVHGHRAGTGSGVVWNDDGLVITNHHVAPGERAEVSLGRERGIPARVIARSESHDLAALQLERPLPAGRYRAAEVGDSTRLRVGELVVAVGNPMGERNAVTMGIVSGTGTLRHYYGGREAVQVAITLRPGNSGGALADVRGRVVGIPNMVVGSGIALAVPSHLVGRLLLEGAEGRAVFGILGQWVDLPERLVASYELPATAGLLVMGVEAGSPAERAGLIMGDVVVAAHVDGEQPGDPGLLAELHRAPVGQPVRLTLLRGGVLRWIDVTPRSA